MTMLAVLAVPAAAQQVTSCASGPGAVFGVVAYQCASCSMKNEGGRQPRYSFFAEPVVTEVDRSAVVATGDVIEAVNGQPITTQAGADEFSHPSASVNSITVRRGRERKVLEVSTRCITGRAVSGTVTAARVGEGVGGVSSIGGLAATAAVGGLGGRTSTGLNAATAGGIGTGGVATTATGSGGRLSAATGIGGVSAGVAATAGGGSGGSYGRMSVGTGEYGFALECRPSCSMRRDANGDYLYKYDGLPSVYAVREGSAADRAGLRAGDIVTRIEGRSLTDGEGILYRASNWGLLHLTVRRDNKDLELVLRP